MITVDLTGDSEDESEQSTSGDRHRPGSSPEVKIAHGEFDSKQDSEYIRRQLLGLPTGDRPRSALLDSIDASNAVMNVLEAASATKASKDKSTSRFQAHQPRSHTLTNKDTRTSLQDSDDDSIVVASTKKPSNSKRSLKAADEEIDDQATSHKRVKMGDTLPDSRVDSPHDAKTSGDESKAQSKRKPRPKFREHSLKSHIENESGWLDTALQSSKTFCQLSLSRTEQLSKLIKFESDFDKLLNEISTDDRPQQHRKLIEQLRNAEERRRVFTNMLFRNVISEYGACAHMKETVEQWILEESKVSKRIEKSS